MLTEQQAVEKINQIIPQDIIGLNNIFNHASKSLFLVGGCIRDTFLGLDAKDIDVCTNATPDEIIDILKKNNIQFNVQGAHFGVIVAKLSEDVEIATFRTESKNTTGEHKDIQMTFGVSLEEDLQRRDFTINALVFDITNNKIIDKTNGISDLKNGIIRAIGNPDERFLEDNLRKLRLVRFSSRFNFMCDTNTFKSVVNNNTLNVSKERIFDELHVCFKRTKSKRNLLVLLNKTGLIHSMFPDCIVNENTNINESCTFTMFLWHILCKNDNTLKDLAALKIPNNIAASICVLQEFIPKLMSNDVINPIQFNKLMRSTCLTQSDFIICSVQIKQKIHWLLNFKLDPQITQDLIASGIIGKDLGIELDKIAIDKFKNKF